MQMRDQFRCERGRRSYNDNALNLNHFKDEKTN